MIHRLLTDHFLFCCLSKEQMEEIRPAMEQKEYQKVYSAQNNLVPEKHGFRCRNCGTLHPYWQITHNNSIVDPIPFSKPTGKIYKHKKAATILFKSHYYATNKKSLLKFKIFTNGKTEPIDSIPIMSGVYHTVLSQDESYLATETFSGTICIIDMCTKETVAIKRKCKSNGHFIFNENNQLLYFYEETIRCWSFLEDKDTILWQAPAEWKILLDSNREMHITCSNVLFNKRRQSILFVCKSLDTTYIVIFKSGTLSEMIRLPGASSLSKLVYSEECNCYTLTTNEHVTVYNEDFQVIETWIPPLIFQTSNFGGLSPIMRKQLPPPSRAILSPDGRFLLLDYFTFFILLEKETQNILFCLYSHTGNAARHIGFLDNNHFWYAWGDTTYIQQIEC